MHEWSLLLLQSGTTHRKLWLNLFAGQTKISLEETGGTDGAELVRTFDVWQDGELLGEVQLWTFQSLGLMVEPSYVVIWTGVKFYWVDVQNKALHEHEQDEEVQGVCLVGSLLLLVREISVTLFDPKTSSVLDVVPLSDVNIGWNWDGSLLLVTDFQQRQFEISVNGWQLIVREW